MVLIDNLTSFKFHAHEAHHRNMGLWNFQEDCSIVMVLWIWAFCTIFLSNYFTLIVLCLDVSLCDLYSQSWQMGCQNNSEGHNSICPCQSYGVCWLTNRLPNFGRECTVYFLWVAYQPFFFISKILPKRDLIKTLKFENIFFLEDFNHQKWGGKTIVKILKFLYLVFSG
jgi:hypothetical protein